MNENSVITGHPNQKNAGFSILEMAIVLMILGSLLSGLLVALSNVSESNRRISAKAQLDRVEEALYVFAQANGRLPCPAIDTSNGGLDGAWEDPVGGGDCTVQHGFVPTLTLNLYGSVNEDGFLLDPWANPLRYSVSTKTSGALKAFTSADGLRDLFSAGPLTSADMLQVCEDISDCAGSVIADLVPAIVFSMGSDWATYTATELEEVANGGGPPDGSGDYTLTDTTNFVQTGYSEDQFDDILLWLSPFVLYSRLIEAGQLP